MKSYVVPERKHEDQGPTFPFRKVLAINLTPAFGEEDITKAFLRICQEHKSIWSLQDLKSIFKAPSILLLYTYISRSKCAPHLHITRPEKIFGKETAVLSQSVDIAHAALIQIRMLQLKENCVILPDFHSPPHTKRFIWSCPTFVPDQHLLQHPKAYPSGQSFITCLLGVIYCKGMPQRGETGHFFSKQSLGKHFWGKQGFIWSLIDRGRGLQMVLVWVKTLQ